MNSGIALTTVVTNLLNIIYILKQILKEGIINKNLSMINYN